MKKLIILVYSLHGPSYIWEGQGKEKAYKTYLNALSKCPYIWFGRQYPNLGILLNRKKKKTYKLEN